jgi:ligand-binding sensor domain-containing protein
MKFPIASKSEQQKMKKLLCRIALFLILLCSLYPLQSVGQQVRIFNSNNSGLPHNEITAMAIDALGNKWFGTYYGEVVKFDDTNWTVYNQSNSGLSGDLINSIAVDSLDNVWVGTIDFNAKSRGELLKFDKTNWTVFNNSNSGLPYAGITDIAIDALGNKWIGTDGGGIVKFDNTNWTIYNNATTGLSLDYIGLIEIDMVGNIWVNSGMNLFKFDASQWTSIDVPEFEWAWYRSVQSMVIDAEGNKWMGTMEDSDLHGGVIKFDNETWYYYNNNNNPGLPRQFVMSCAIDVQGNKWFGMSDWWHNEALVRFDGSNWTVYNSANSDLPDVFIRLMVIDKKGTIWLGTGASGVVEFNDYQIKTGLYDDISVNSNGFNVYPNPAKNLITIEGLESGTIEIFNSAGAVLKNSEIHGIITNVDISHLSGGIYFIRAVRNDDAVAKIFIKEE